MDCGTKIGYLQDFSVVQYNNIIFILTPLYKIVDYSVNIHDI